MRKSAAWLLGLLALSSASAQERLLYDFESKTPKPQLSNAEYGLVSRLANQALKQGAWYKTFGDTYSPHSASSCPEFAVMGKAKGSFTQQQSEQVAYLYSCFYGGMSAAQGIVIAQNGKAAAHYTFAGQMFNLYSVRDINRNGYSELALEGSYGDGGGGAALELGIAEFKPQRRYLAYFGIETNMTVYAQKLDYSQNAPCPFPTWQGRNIWVTPGMTPQFRSQLLGGGCDGETITWRSDKRVPLTVRSLPTDWNTGPL